MSKHIRRGLKDSDSPLWIRCNLLTGKGDCTVIDDSACFPVKEARALCKIACEFSERSHRPGCLYPGYGGLWDAVDAFKKAQERMRKKAGK